MNKISITCYFFILSLSFLSYAVDITNQPYRNWSLDSRIEGKVVHIVNAKLIAIEKSYLRVEENITEIQYMIRRATLPEEEKTELNRVINEMPPGTIPDPDNKTPNESDYESDYRDNNYLLIRRWANKYSGKLIFSNLKTVTILRENETKKVIDRTDLSVPDKKYLSDLNDPGQIYENQNLTKEGGKVYYENEPSREWLNTSEENNVVIKQGKLVWLDKDTVCIKSGFKSYEIPRKILNADDYLYLYSRNDKYLEYNDFVLRVTGVMYVTMALEKLESNPIYAIDQLKELSEKWNYSMEPDYCLGMIYALGVRHWITAKTYFERCDKKKSNDIGTLNNLAILNMILREHGKALKYWKQAIELIKEGGADYENTIVGSNLKYAMDCAGKNMMSGSSNLLRQLSAIAAEVDTSVNPEAWVFIPCSQGVSGEMLRSQLFMRIVKIDVSSLLRYLINSDDEYKRPIIKIEDKPYHLGLCMKCMGVGTIECPIKNCRKGTLKVRVPQKIHVKGPNGKSGATHTRYVYVDKPCYRCSDGRVSCPFCNGGALTTQGRQQ